MSQAYPDQVKEEFKRLRTTGITLKEISKQMKIPYGTICRWSRFSEPPIILNRYAPQPEWKKESCRRLLNEDFCIKYIAEALEVAECTVRRWRKKFEQMEIEFDSQDETTQKAIAKVVCHFFKKGIAAEEIQRKLSLTPKQVYTALEIYADIDSKHIAKIKHIKDMLRQTAKMVKTTDSRRDIIIRLNDIYEFCNKE